MLKVTKYSIPVVLAGLVFTGRTDDSSAQAQQQQQQRAQQQAQKEQVSQQRQNQQSTFQPGAITDSELNKQVTDVNKASSFIGMAVKNTQNEDVGKINDLVFDPQSGKISYAVLSVGGILGVGDKLVAIPITSLKPQPGQKHLVLNMQKSQIETAPGLAQNNWPDLDAPGLGAAAGSESGSASATTPQTSDSPTPSASGTAPSSPSTRSGSNSDSSQSSPTSTEPSASTGSGDVSATQGETKKTDE